MKTLSIAATALSLSLVSPALANDEPVKFVHDGVSYVYSVKAIGETKRVITGRATPGSSFRLVVSGDQVSGTANGIPVAFSVAEAKGQATPSVTVASRAD